MTMDANSAIIIPAHHAVIPLRLQSVITPDVARRLNTQALSELIDAELQRQLAALPADTPP